MTDALTALARIATMLLALVAHPPVTRCPPGFWLSTGVRRDGRFVCTRVPVGDDYRDARGIVHDDSVVPPGIVEGWAWCGIARPIVVDYRTVGCMKGAAQ